MKHIFLKTALAALLMGGVATSCVNDLNISSIDPQSSSSYGDMELLAKIYSTLGLTGQKGPAGSTNSRFDGYQYAYQIVAISVVMKVKADSTVLHSIYKNFVPMNAFGLGRLTLIFLKSPILTGRLHLFACNGRSSVWLSM